MSTPVNRRGSRPGPLHGSVRAGVAVDYAGRVNEWDEFLETDYADDLALVARLAESGVAGRGAGAYVRY